MKPRRDLVRSAYAALLRLYPRSFRRRYAADLLQGLEDRRAEPRFAGALGRARLALFLLGDFLRSLPLTFQATDVTIRDGMMNDFVRDLRFSFRMLTKNPVFTVAAVLTLALGIGLNTATFSTLRQLLLAPLPGTERPDELVQLYREWPGIPFGSNSIPHYQDVRDQTGEVFENVAAWNFAPMSLSADGRSERIIGLTVSANFFQTYGVDPALGRAFIPGVEDTAPGAHPVAILGHSFWQTRFGGDPDALGSTVVLNGLPYEVVGVAPSDFGGPWTVIDAPIFVPIMMLAQIQPGSTLLEARGSNSFNAIARIRDGHTVESARDMFEALLLRWNEEYPAFYERQLGTRIVPQSEAGIHPSFGSAQVGMGAVMMVVVGLLLLIACVNVANLFLARARDRRREMGLRLSLGAGRGRIVRQLLTESVVFALIAGGVGLVMSRAATGLLQYLRPPIDGPFRFSVEPDPTMLGFTLLISVAAGILFGMAPALHAARPDTMTAIRGDGPAGRSRASRLLVIAQMALSLLLLISSGLFLRSLQGATAIDPGFEDPSTLVVASLDPGLQGYDQPRTRALLDRIVDDVQAIPGVESTALIHTMPLSLGSSDTRVDIPGYQFAEGEPQNAFYTMVDLGYFETMGIRVLEGGTFDRGHDAEGPPVIIVNERFAERFWPGESALGKIVETASEEREVIGVVETGKYNSLGEEPAEFMYFPHREIYRSDMTIVTRSQANGPETLEQIRRVVRSADPDLPLYDVRTMEEHMGTALLPARLGGSVIGIFGLLGLVLAGVGVYGVMAYSVSQRRHELGVRVALGASRSSVVGLVLREGMQLALVGAAIGLVAAAASARLVEGLLYGVDALDPVAFIGVPLLLMGVAALAVYMPARRASRVDPIGALRAD